MIQPLSVPAISYARPEVLRARHVYGLFYGLVVGMAFAAWAWGMDAYSLSQAHAIQPWLKFSIGAVVCGLVGGLAGWLVMKIEKGWAAALIWLAASSVFAWLSVVLPFKLAPQILRLSMAVPGSIPNTVDQDLGVRVGLAYVWVAIFVLVAGVLELPMGEAAAFSTSVFGKLGPSLLCVALMGISGFMVDNLNNQPLRDAVVLTDSTIQFLLDHEGQQIDPQVSRSMHLPSLRAVTDLLNQPRQLTVGEYDRWLGDIHVLVKFGDQWVDCLTTYNQMSNCTEVPQ